MQVVNLASASRLCAIGEINNFLLIIVVAHFIVMGPYKWKAVT